MGQKGKKGVKETGSILHDWACYCRLAISSVGKMAFESETTDKWELRSIESASSREFLCPAKRTKMSKPRQNFCVIRTFLLLKASWCRAQLSKAGAREELDAFTRSLSWSRYLWSLAYCNRPHETLCGLLACVGPRTHVLPSNQNLLPINFDARTF